MAFPGHWMGIQRVENPECGVPFDGSMVVVILLCAPWNDIGCVERNADVVVQLSLQPDNEHKPRHDDVTVDYFISRFLPNHSPDCFLTLCGFSVRLEHLYQKEIDER
jgi:hypothetical protein